MKKGTDFEALIKAIYEEILAFDGVHTVCVQHDIDIKGRSGQPHQIDVYWEFNLANVLHRVAIECKDHKKAKIPVGKIRDFRSVLEDIGNIQGIFVTTVGFQSGAITYAQHYGIHLKVVRAPTPDEIDTHQGIKGIGLNINVVWPPAITSINPIFDKEWMLKNTDIFEGDQLPCSGLTDGDIKIVDSKNNLLGTLYDFEKSVPIIMENTKGLRYKFDFSDGFMAIPYSGYPPLKLAAIEFEYNTFSSTKIQIESSYQLMAEAILKDIITGDFHLFKKKITV